jgi:transcription elongation factor GreB
MWRQHNPTTRSIWHQAYLNSILRKRNEFARRFAGRGRIASNYTAESATMRVPFVEKAVLLYLPAIQFPMSKAFTKESDSADTEVEETDALPAHSKNYVTPRGLAALQEEFRKLLYDERPKVVEIVSWAAGNGDRSENGDYLYGKKRLREIDARVRYLTKRIESAEVVDPARQKNQDQVFFGATVEYARTDKTKQKLTIVGIDEADLANGKINWLSPVARALMKARVGDVIEIRTPSGPETVEVLSITYGAGK